MCIPTLDDSYRSDSQGLPGDCSINWSRMVSTYLKNSLEVPGSVKTIQIVLSFLLHQRPTQGISPLSTMWIRPMMSTITWNKSHSKKACETNNPYYHTKRFLIVIATPFCLYRMRPWQSMIPKSRDTTILHRHSFSCTLAEEKEGNFHRHLFLYVTGIYCCDEDYRRRSRSFHWLCGWGATRVFEVTYWFRFVSPESVASTLDSKDWNHQSSNIVETGHRPPHLSENPPLFSSSLPTEYRRDSFFLVS